MTEDQLTPEQAKADLARYAQALPSTNAHVVCGALERRWDLYGYPPAVVCAVLAGVANGEDRFEAEARALGQDGGDEEDRLQSDDLQDLGPYAQ